MDRVSKSFRTESVETRALNDVSLEIHSGEFVAITGPSGSGKSTFLNVAGLLESFDQGTYELDDQDVSGLNDHRLSKLRNEIIGFVFQSFNLIPELNIADNVELPLRYRTLSSTERKKRVAEYLDIVGLAGRTGHYPAELSGGQQQRAAIARALVGEPRFLLADEPTGNLDSAAASSVFQLLKNLHSDGTTIVMVTHDDDLAKQAGSVIRLLDGQVQRELTGS